MRISDWSSDVCSSDLVILNWRTEGEERWEIDIVSRTGSNLKLQKGGSELKIDGSPVVQHGIGEYPGIYQRFAHLLRSGQSHVDVEPLRLVADAFLLQHRRTSEAFQGLKIGRASCRERGCTYV